MLEEFIDAYYTVYNFVQQVVKDYPEEAKRILEESENK